MRDLVPGDVVSVANEALADIRGILVRIRDDGKAIIRLVEHEDIVFVVPVRLVSCADANAYREDDR